MKIKNIEVNGHLDFRRVTPWDYYQTHAEFWDGGKGIQLPSWQAIVDVGCREALWILLKDVTITITLKNSRMYQYKLKRGFIWDKLSVPIFRNNLLKGMVAGMVHDPNFSCKFLGTGRKGFRKANSLFCAMCKYYGMGFLRFIWHRAVGSIPGRAIFEKAGRRAFWHGQTVEFMESR